MDWMDGWMDTPKIVVTPEVSTCGAKKQPNEIFG